MSAAPPVDDRRPGEGRGLSSPATSTPGQSTPAAGENLGPRPRIESGAGSSPGRSTPAAAENLRPRPSPGRSTPAAWIGFRTLLYKEVLRFWKVSFQTIAAPVLTGVLYLLVFGHVLEKHVEAFPGVSYTAFLIPGLVMMSVLQNSFANSSSSLIQSKITGNLVFMLLPPLSHLQFFGAYVIGSIARGLLVGLGVYAVTLWFAPEPLLHAKAPLWILLFALAGSALLGVLGLIAGIVSDKFDQLAAFQNFIIMPATFLSGVFYSVHGLPPFWQAVSHVNPFFYIVDGFRYGFFAQADVSPWISFAVVLTALALASAIALGMLARGYKIRH